VCRKRQILFPVIVAGSVNKRLRIGIAKLVNDEPMLVKGVRD